MFVVDTSIINLEIMKVTVISLNGAEWVVDVLPEFTIDKLKLMALSHFFNPIDSIKFAEHYKLVLISKGRPLPDESTVRDEKLKENDELLLLKRRQQTHGNSETMEEKEEKAHGPNEAAIQQATENILPKNLDRVIEDTPVVVDFHTELRKILVSLVQASESLLRYHPEIIAIFKEMPGGESSESEGIVDPLALKQLTDMGFPKDKAIKALKINRMSSIDAMEWLLAHETDSEGSSSSPATRDANFSSSSMEVSVASDTASLSGTPPPTQSSSPGPSHPSEDVRHGPVFQMLQCFRAYKRKVFRPNMKALANLKEMGFSDMEILDALRVNANNQNAACEWLLSDKKPSMENLECGLDMEGPVYKAIMANPVVQLGLSNPKTFLALLHMLENPNSASRWLSDPDTAPILSQIFRIYHAEKHSLQLARPFSH